jgi:hypothetical protein
MTAPALRYPHEGYKRVLSKISGYYKDYPGVYAIVLLGSLARNKAVDGSCIDLCIFLKRAQFDALPATLGSRETAYSRLGGSICYYNDNIEGGIMFKNVRVDVCFTDGQFNPSTKNSFDIVRDAFETTIGNLFVYATTLYQSGTKYQQLKAQYLPFYDDTLRKVRLTGTTREFRYKLWKTRWLAQRAQFFAALEALLEANRIFLQHLFIRRRTYPIDYTKWLKEQLSQILKVPALYRELAALINGIELTIEAFEARSLSLERLFARYESSARKSDLVD